MYVHIGHWLSLGYAIAQVIYYAKILDKKISEDDQIIRCEADSNYTHIFLKNRTSIVACRTLKEIEEQLHDFNYFLRVHHSYIVNLNEVTKYIRGEGGYLVMVDGSTVNVSHSRKDALLKLF